MENKIIFTGPIGAGKTSVIHAISDIMIIGAATRAYDARIAGDGAAQCAEHTTVAMDYGLIYLADRERVHLYGTLGEGRPDQIWEALTENAMGFVIMLDGTRPDPAADLEYYLDAFHRSISSSGDIVVAGVTHTESARIPGLMDACHKRLDALQLNIPVFEVDGRNREDVKVMLMSMLAMIDPTIH